MTTKRDVILANNNRIFASVSEASDFIREAFSYEEVPCVCFTGSNKVTFSIPFVNGIGQAVDFVRSILGDEPVNVIYDGVSYVTFRVAQN